MTTALLDQANKDIRQAVEQRREAQAAGLPHEQWYDTVQAKSGATADDIIERFAGERHPSSTAFIQLLGEMQRLHESKSADYGSEEDPLANIRQGADFVCIEPWRGCMVRIADKVQRLRTYCRTGRLVHEGVRDTLLDLAAYSLLAIVLFDEGNNA